MPSRVIDGGDAVRRRPVRPSAAPRHVIGRDDFAFEQHPAQHVLRRRHRPVRRRRDRARSAACVVLLDAFALEIERREIALADRHRRAAAASVSHCTASAGIALDAEPFGEAGADIVLRARDAGMRERPPDRQRARVIAAADAS